MSLSSAEPKRVLVVDCQQSWREVLGEALEPGYELVAVAGPDEAVRRLRERAFHVVVTELCLAEADPRNVDGLRVLDAVKECRDGTRAIVVSGYPTLAAAKAALQGRDAFDCLLKYPEKGGFFRIHEYRERVQEAARLAAVQREGKQKRRITTKDTKNRRDG